MNTIALFFTGLLYPFTYLIRIVFKVSYTVTGNYGIALVLLSFFITVITAPLYYLAEKWKDTERTIQKNMNKDFQSIKNNFRGQKRFYLIKAARRIYNYKWWYAFRTSFGLIIQIPFFFAAYEVLSQYTGYKGVPFLFIADLGLPDNLVFGINILPFVMTAVNIAYSIYYTKCTTWQANKELYSMAVLFLLLLYSSPSALLIYWTMNNVFSFIKGIILRKTGLSQVPVMIVSPSNKTLKQVLYENLNIVWFFLFSLCCSIQVYSLSHNSVRHKYVLLGFFGAAFILTAIRIVYKPNRKNIYRIFTVWLVYTPLIYLLLFTLRSNAYISPDNIKLLNGFYIAFIIVYAIKQFFISVPKKSSEAMSVYDSLSIIFFIIFWLFFYLPLLFYINNPFILTIGIYEYISQLVLPAAAAFVCLFIIYYVLPFTLKTQYCRALFFVLTVMFIYSVILKLNIGELDFFVLKNADVLFGMEWHYIFDAFILTGILYGSGYLFFRYRKTVVLFNVLLPVLLSLVLIIQYNTTPRRAVKTASGVHTTESGLPPSAYSNYILSKNKQNVVCILTDMFNGNYLGRILQEDIGYCQKLSGFTWYPDCLSVSISTTRSLGGLLGGYAYMHKASKLMVYDEINTKAAAQLFENIALSGYDVALTPTEDYADIDMSNYHKIDETGILSYWKKMNGYAEEGNLNTVNVGVLIMLGILQSVPYHLKLFVYDNEEWLFFHKTGKLNTIRHAAMKNLSSLDILPVISAAKDTERGKCIYIHSMLPHYPYAINRSGKIMAKNEFGHFSHAAFNNADLAVSAAKCTIDCLINWFDWMKAQGVYDNTVIYIFSDHGNTFYDSDIPLPDAVSYKNVLKNLSAANTLLLIKPANAVGSLITDELYVSSADLYSMLVNDAGLHRIEDIDPRTQTSAVNRSRTRYFFGPDVYFLKNDMYYIRGSIFDSKAWSMYPPQN